MPQNKGAFYFSFFGQYDIIPLVKRNYYGNI